VVRRVPLVVCFAAIAAFAGFLYLSRLSASGLLGPDEPRYASIAREMARSGDWVTPRLWGGAWFEKPPLDYWMSAAGFRLGLGPELAPRLPVALLSLAFLGFYWWILRREFGPRPALYAALILATSLGWLGFSQVGVTDLPMTAAFSAAMLLALPWVSKGDPRPLPLTGALLGLAVLAKGLVPVVLAVPLVIFPGASSKFARLRQLLSLRVIAPFLAVSLPWYFLCYLQNGRQFLQVFFWQQQFERFRSPALEHTQPWWFYLPVLLAGLLPWTPLASLVSPRRTWQDPRRKFLLAWVLFGLLFFSLAVNKLPGYVLPLMPAVCALVGIGLAESDGSRSDRAKLAPALALAGSALLLVLFPIADQILPQTISAGLSRAPKIHCQWSWLIPPLIGWLAWIMVRRGRHSAALAMIAISACSGYFYLKFATLPRVDAAASARYLWQGVQTRRAETCIQSLNRNFRYGLNYYSDTLLPDCSGRPEPFVIRQSAGEEPGIVKGMVPSP
jgi:4-amino-4-deoxy-L-arabinose transferase-like glycosyltransferase